MKVEWSIYFCDQNGKAIPQSPFYSLFRSQDWPTHMPSNISTLNNYIIYSNISFWNFWNEHICSMSSVGYVDRSSLGHRGQNKNNVSNFLWQNAIQQPNLIVMSFSSILRCNMVYYCVFLNWYHWGASVPLDWSVVFIVNKFKDTLLYSLRVKRHKWK